MKFIIKSNAKIPGFGGIRGPILTPQEIPAKKVLDMVSKGCKIYEVMEDGSHRKVEFSDSRVFEQMMKEKKPTSSVETKVKEKTLFKDARLLTEKEIEDAGIKLKNMEKIDIVYANKELKEAVKKDKEKFIQEETDKIFKKDKKSDKKSNSPIVDKVESLSDDK
jgi:preprotein translocase subunit SecF